ncbi:MAG: hypothetical protein H6978_11105 [Gammaproteobacteria bacterium]|nr:hypothetical protein [Gammaproteobacteria bacterium]
MAPSPAVPVIPRTPELPIRDMWIKSPTRQLAALLAVMLSYFGHPTCASAQAALDRVLLDDGEYEVLAAVLDHGLNADTLRLVIAADTQVQRRVQANLASDPHYYFGDETPSAPLIDDFLLVNQQQTRLEARLPLDIEYQLLSQADLNAVLAAGGWPGFYDKYPTAPGVLRFSRVGFDAQSHTALVAVEQLCGSECGAGRLMTLSRDDTEQWHVQASYLVWLAGPAERPAPEPPPAD